MNQPANQSTARLQARFAVFCNGTAIAKNLTGDSAIFLKNGIPQLVVKFTHMAVGV